MAWYADGAPCDYFGDELANCLKAVGWLEQGQPFASGRVDPQIYTRILEFLHDPWQPFLFRGLHECDLCCYTRDQVGFKNLFIPGDGYVFVCPELIAHYMNAHWYRPPDAFCGALLVCPPMRSAAYFKALLANGARPLVKKANLKQR